MRTGTTAAERTDVNVNERSVELEVRTMAYTTPRHQFNISLDFQTTRAVVSDPRIPSSPTLDSFRQGLGISGERLDGRMQHDTEESIGESGEEGERMPCSIRAVKTLA